MCIIDQGNSALGRAMTTTCPITNEPCFQTYYGAPKRCIEKTTLEDAALCIKKLRATNLEMAREIEALDELVEQLKEKKYQH